MRRVFLLLGIMPLVLSADSWVKYTRGPFEVLTDAGSRPGRETLVRLEQFRHAFGQILGEQDLQTPLPVRVFVFKNPRGWASEDPITLGRDRYAIVLGEKTPIGPEINRALAQLFFNPTPLRCRSVLSMGLLNSSPPLRLRESGLPQVPRRPRPISIGLASTC